jgi:hypothetical protein
VGDVAVTLRTLNVHPPTITTETDERIARAERMVGLEWKRCTSTSSPLVLGDEVVEKAVPCQRRAGHDGEHRGFHPARGKVTWTERDMTSMDEKTESERRLTRMTEDKSFPLTVSLSVTTDAGEVIRVEQTAYLLEGDLIDTETRNLIKSVTNMAKAVL